MKKLTKTLYVNGRDCDRLLWSLSHEKQVFSEADEYRFAQGIMIGELAQGLYPDAEFEVVFENGSAYARSDMVLNEELIEVKSSTRPKEDHYHDVAFQMYVSGLKRASLVTINNQYVKRGDVEIGKLFDVTDVTRKALELVPSPAKVNRMIEVINQKVKPAACDRDECPECRVSVKEKGKPVINKEGVRKWLDALVEPVHYLDFETYSTPIPIFDGTRPYEKIVFQYVAATIGEVKEYLHSAGSDPRKNLLQKLLHDLGSVGSVVVFNKTFEKTVLSELKRLVPEKGEEIDNIISRLVDLHDVFRYRYYYNPKQNGRTSLKVVMPLLTKRGYDKLRINDGDLAGVRYVKAVVNDEGGKDEVLRDLKVYCGQDTVGMIDIVESLKKLL